MEQSGVKWFMFYGEYEHTLDEKGRIIIPSRFRDIFKAQSIEKVYLTRGLDRCLFMFTEEVWKAQDKRFKEMPFTKQEARQFNRLYFSGASEEQLDKQGRILLQPYLKEHAGIQSRVMIVGVSDRIEVWALERWNAYVNESLISFESIAEKLVE